MISIQSNARCRMLTNCSKLKPKMKSQMKVPGLLHISLKMVDPNPSTSRVREDWLAPLRAPFLSLPFISFLLHLRPWFAFSNFFEWFLLAHRNTVLFISSNCFGYYGLCLFNWIDFLFPRDLACCHCDFYVTILIGCCTFEQRKMVNFNATELQYDTLKCPYKPRMIDTLKFMSPMQKAIATNPSTFIFV